MGIKTEPEQFNFYANVTTQLDKMDEGNSGDGVQDLTAVVQNLLQQMVYICSHADDALIF